RGLAASQPGTSAPRRRAMRSMTASRCISACLAASPAGAGTSAPALEMEQDDPPEVGHPPRVAVQAADPGAQVNALKVQHNVQVGPGDRDPPGLCERAGLHVPAG